MQGLNWDFTSFSYKEYTCMLLTSNQHILKLMIDYNWTFLHWLTFIKTASTLSY